MKLHLGCDDKRLEGFVNIDIRREVHPDIVADVRSLHMYDGNSVDLIYFSHGLEHIQLRQVGATLREWRRILKPGGWLYLAVPDFTVLASLYVSGQVQLSQIVPALCGGYSNEADIHYTLWDIAFLTQHLHSAGFNTVERYDPVEFLPAGFWDYSKFEIVGVLASLNVRAS